MSKSCSSRIQFLIMLLLAAYLQGTNPSRISHKPHGRLFSSLLGYPSSCVVDNSLHRCTFTFTCWLVGGALHRGCSEAGGAFDLVADILFTCCVPASRKVEVTLQPTIRRDDVVSQVIRREDIDHRNNEIVGSTRTECGVPQLNFQKRIIGGNEAYFGEFPWQAHIRIAGYQCGGVLVSRVLVATAAHCIHKARLKDIIVYLGEYDTQNTGHYIEPYPEELHRVTKKIIHPSFQYRITQPDRFDLALLKLARPVTYKENILPICLPRPDVDFRGQTGVVAGWGKTDTTYGKTGTNILQKATVPILSDAECLRWHQHKNIHLELHTEMFCAGHDDGHMDACLGDSGGPLIVYSEGRWTLAGITSAGFGCAVDHQPGIYHQIPDTTMWIKAYVDRE